MCILFAHVLLSICHHSLYIVIGKPFLYGFSVRAQTETKEECDRSHIEPTKFLNLDETMLVLGDDCLNYITKLQDNLWLKKYKSVGCMHLHITNCMDTYTTSPVELNNNAIKHGPSAINARTNLDNTMKKLLGGINCRFEWRKRKARCELYTNYLALCAPTAEHLIQKGRGLIDRNHDAHHYLNW